MSLTPSYAAFDLPTSQAVVLTVPTGSQWIARLEVRNDSGAPRDVQIWIDNGSRTDPVLPGDTLKILDGEMAVKLGLTLPEGATLEAEADDTGCVGQLYYGDKT